MFCILAFQNGMAMSRTIACVIAELDESLPEQEVERLLSALDEFSERVEDVAPGVACVELDGMEPMHGCERCSTRCTSP